MYGPFLGRGSTFQTLTESGTTSLQSGQHILDAGCGPGVDTIPLADYVGPQGSVTGVDIDSEMLDKANQAADVAGHTGGDRPVGR